MIASRLSNYYSSLSKVGSAACIAFFCCFFNYLEANEEVQKSRRPAEEVIVMDGTGSNSLHRPTARGFSITTPSDEKETLAAGSIHWPPADLSYMTFAMNLPVNVEGEKVGELDQGGGTYPQLFALMMIHQSGAISDAQLYEFVTQIGKEHPQLLRIYTSGRWVGLTRMIADMYKYNEYKDEQRKAAGVSKKMPSRQPALFSFGRPGKYVSELNWGTGIDPSLFPLLAIEQVQKGHAGVGSSNPLDILNQVLNQLLSQLNLSSILDMEQVQKGFAGIDSSNPLDILNQVLKQILDQLNRSGITELLVGIAKSIAHFNASLAEVGDVLDLFYEVHQIDSTLFTISGQLWDFHGKRVHVELPWEVNRDQKRPRNELAWEISRVGQGKLGHFVKRLLPLALLEMAIEATTEKTPYSKARVYGRAPTLSRSRYYQLLFDQNHGQDSHGFTILSTSLETALNKIDVLQAFPELTELRDRLGLGNLSRSEQVMRIAAILHAAKSLQKKVILNDMRVMPKKHANLDRNPQILIEYKGKIPLHHLQKTEPGLMESDLELLHCVGSCFKISGNKESNVAFELHHLAFEYFRPELITVGKHYNPSTLVLALIYRMIQPFLTQLERSGAHWSPDSTLLIRTTDLLFDQYLTKYVTQNPSQQASGNELESKSASQLSITIEIPLNALEDANDQVDSRDKHLAFSTSDCRHSFLNR